MFFASFFSHFVLKQCFNLFMLAICAPLEEKTMLKCYSVIFKGWALFFLLWLNSERINKCEQGNPLAFHFISMAVAHLYLPPCKCMTWTLASFLKITPETYFHGRLSEPWMPCDWKLCVMRENIHLFYMKVTSWDMKSYCRI